MRWCLLVLVVAVPSCEFVVDDPQQGSEVSPRVLGSSPATGEVEVPACGSATFTARGEDEDSLHLDWGWTLDEVLQAGGTAEDGAFDTTWELPWSEDRADSFVEVRFFVSDGSLDAEVYWPVSFGPTPCRR